MVILFISNSLLYLVLYYSRKRAHCFEMSSVSPFPDLSGFKDAHWSGEMDELAPWLGLVRWYCGAAKAVATSNNAIA